MVVDDSLHSLFVVFIQPYFENHEKSMEKP